jgi:branched-chain amino acid transport system ATP-binding protein
VKRFGGVTALAGVDVELHRREVLGLIGPNGSGKTTLVNCLSGVLGLTEGTILLDGGRIDRWSRVRRAKHGLARTFQNVQLFGDLTVKENVAVGLNASRRGHDARSLSVDELTERLGLTDLRREVVRSLPYGHQRRVEIARALAGWPAVLLLDEPATGLNDAETADLLQLLGRIKGEFGCSMLVIDHDMALVMGVSDRVQVLDDGHVIFAGAPADALRQQNVIEAYLGAD